MQENHPGSPAARHEREQLEGRGTTLVGDAVIVGLPDKNGADTAVPAKARELLLTSDSYLVEVQLAGDDQWYVGLPVWLDYWDALMWATLLLEQIPGAGAIRVIPVNHVDNAASV